MSEECGSISGHPSVIHSATVRPNPGPSLTQMAATDHSPRTSGVSPTIGMPSGVSEISPLTAYFTPTRSSATISGKRVKASSICGSKSSLVKGSSVGDCAACSIEGMPSGSRRIGRWA